MKKFISLIIVSLFFVVFAVAEQYPSATSAPTRPYTFDDYYNLVLQDGDLDPNNLCGTIWAMIEGSIGADDTLKSVSLDSSILRITVDWPASAIAPLTNGMYAQSCASSITDTILDYPELDQYWNGIVLFFPDASAVFTKDMSVGSEYGRYIDILDIMDQIPD